MKQRKQFARTTVRAQTASRRDTARRVTFCLRSERTGRRPVSSRPLPLVAARTTAVRWCAARTCPLASRNTEQVRCNQTLTESYRRSGTGYPPAAVRYWPLGGRRILQLPPLCARVLQRHDLEEPSSTLLLRAIQWLPVHLPTADGVAELLSMEPRQRNFRRELSIRIRHCAWIRYELLLSPGASFPDDDHTVAHQ